MLTTPHTLLGLYFITHFPLEIALPAALISHFLFDFFWPHWNPHLYTEMKQNGGLSTQTFRIIFADLFIAVSLTSYFAFKAYPNLTQMLLIFLAAFLAIMPDFIEMPYYFLKSKNGILKKIVDFEHKHQAKAGPFWGIVSQLVVISLCLWELFN